MTAFDRWLLRRLTNALVKLQEDSLHERARVSRNRSRLLRDGVRYTREQKEKGIV